MQRTFFVLVFVVLLFSASTLFAASKKEEPLYRTEGSIGGTSLLFKNLEIDGNQGHLVVLNPTGRDRVFSATFSFFDAKGKLVESFIVEGKAVIKINNYVRFQVNNAKKIKKSVRLVALGREVG